MTISPQHTQGITPAPPRTSNTGEPHTLTFEYNHPPTDHHFTLDYVILTAPRAPRDGHPAELKT